MVFFFEVVLIFLAQNLKVTEVGFIVGLNIFFHTLMFIKKHFLCYLHSISINLNIQQSEETIQNLSHSSALQVDAT